MNTFKTLSDAAKFASETGGELRESVSFLLPDNWQEMVRQQLPGLWKAVQKIAAQRWNGDVGCAWLDMLDGNGPSDACNLAMTVDDRLRKRVVSYVVVSVSQEKTVQEKRSESIAANYDFDRPETWAAEAYRCGDSITDDGW